MLRTFIQVLARRPAELIDTLRIADLELDPVHRRVTRAGTAIALTPKEYAMLEYLMRNAGRSVTRKMLLENVWSSALDVLPHAVDAGISRLRSKIHDVTGTKLIHTIRGVGYLLAEEKSEDRGAA